jgi:hypothetical protein
MAISRLSLTNIKGEIFDIFGVDESTNAPWETDAALYLKINMTAQKLAQRVSQILAGQGKPVEADLVRFDMWRTIANSTDSDQWISFWDLTHDKWIYPIERKHSERFRRLRLRAPGPAEALEILDFDSDSNGQRQSRLWPEVASGVTPSIEMTYYRLPTAMPGSDPDNEYPDADPKFHYLWVLEPILELFRVDDPSYRRYVEEEQMLVRQLAATARAIT